MNLGKYLLAVSQRNVGLTESVFEEGELLRSMQSTVMDEVKSHFSQAVYECYCDKDIKFKTNGRKGRMADTIRRGFEEPAKIAGRRFWGCK